MRLTDTVLRRGHLSEEVLAEVCLTGARPAHIDRCDICAERAIELSRWLDGVRDAGIDTADRAFPTEKLAEQQMQILRRLEQIDQPKRVIAFPGFSRGTIQAPRRRIAPAWIGVAAAAGIVLGVAGEHLTLRLSNRATALPTSPTAPSATALELAAKSVVQSAGLSVPDRSEADVDLLNGNFTQVSSSTLGALEGLMPRADLLSRTPRK